MCLVDHVFHCTESFVLLKRVEHRIWVSTSSTTFVCKRLSAICWPIKLSHGRWDTAEGWLSPATWFCSSLSQWTHTEAQPILALLLVSHLFWVVTLVLNLVLVFDICLAYVLPEQCDPFVKFFLANKYRFSKVICDSTVLISWNLPCPCFDILKATCIWCWYPEGYWILVLIYWKLPSSGIDIMKSDLDLVFISCWLLFVLSWRLLCYDFDILKATWIWCWYPDTWMLLNSGFDIPKVNWVLFWFPASWFCFSYPENYLVLVLISWKLPGSGFDILNASKFWFWCSKRLSVKLPRSGSDIRKATWFWSARFLSKCESQCMLPFHGKGPKAKPVYGCLYFQ